MDIAISVYIEAAEDARVKAEAQALSGERAVVVASIGEGLAKLAAQDLTHRIPGPLPDAYSKLQADFNSAIDNLTTVVEGVVTSSDALRSGTWPAPRRPPCS